MKIRPNLLTPTRSGFLAITIAVAGVSPSAFGAQQTWDGAVSGIWDTSALNWQGAAFTSGNDALFTGAPMNNVTSATGLTIGSITLDNAFTGTVAMTGANSVSGATTISGGTLNLTNVGGLGTSAVTVNSGGALSLNAGNNATYSNVISGVGAISVTPGANDAFITGNLSGFTGTLTLNASGGTNSGKARFTTTQGNLISSSATINVSANTTLYLNQALSYGAGINLFGAGNNETLGALRLEAGANQTGSVTLRANSFIGVNGSAATISGAIGQNGGSFGFTKQGNSTLTLSNSINTYTGGTTVTGGTLSLGHATALSGTGALTMSGGNFSNAVTASLSNNITLNNGSTFTSSGGALALNGNITGSPTGNWNLTPTNKITLAGTNSLTFSGNFAGLNINAGVGGVDITGSTTISGASGNTQSGYLNVAGNTTVTVKSTGSLIINGTSNASFPNSIVGQNATGTSNLTIDGGSLTIGGNTGLALGNNRSDATGVLTISSGTATINRGSTTATDVRSFVALGRDSGHGIIDLNGGTLATARNFVLDGNSGAGQSGFTGPGSATFNFNGGKLQALADQTSGNGWFETATTGNYRVVTTTVKVGGAKIDTNGFNANINTVLAHDSGLGATADGGLAKSGAGTLSLGGDNTYTGATSVLGGKLVVNGSTASASAVTVSAGILSATPVATLGGTGTIGGSVALSAESSAGFKNGGVLAPPASASGTALKVTGTTTFNTGSIFEWDLNAVTTDPGDGSTNTGNYGQLAGTGAITGSGSVFQIVLGSNNFSDAFWDTNKSWTNIFTGSGATSDLAAIFSGGFGGSGVSTLGVVADRGGFTFNGASTLTWTAVPEPTGVLAGFLVGAGLLRRRKY